MNNVQVAAGRRQLERKLPSGSAPPTLNIVLCEKNEIQLAGTYQRASVWKSEVTGSHAEPSKLLKFKEEMLKRTKREKASQEDPDADYDPSNPDGDNSESELAKTDDSTDNEGQDEIEDSLGDDDASEDSDDNEKVEGIPSAPPGSTIGFFQRASAFLSRSPKRPPEPTSQESPASTNPKSNTKRKPSTLSKSTPAEAPKDDANTEQPKQKTTGRHRRPPLTKRPISNEAGAAYKT